MAAVLKSLSFTAVPKIAGNPVLVRRAKLIERLDEQKTLLNDPTHTRVVQRWVKVDGEKQPVEKKQRVSPWWRTDLNGNFIMSIKFGSRPVEFEKGKAGIIVQTKEKLVGVIDTLIAAVRAGELDDHLNQAAGTRKIGKVKKAA
jgi:hypothetical protein